MFEQENRKPIVLTDELIDEWVKRTGKSRELLTEMLELHHKYIDYLIDNEPKALILSLPYLGSLRFNTQMAYNYMKRHPVTDARYKPIHDKMATLLELTGNDIFNMKSSNPLILVKLYYKLTGKRFLAMYEKYYSLVKILEEYNNNFVESKQKGIKSTIEDWLPESLIELYREKQRRREEYRKSNKKQNKP